MARERVVFECSACGQRSAQWAGRCAGCGGWGTIEKVSAQAAAASSAASSSVGVLPLVSDGADSPEVRIPTGIDGLDRVLGGGLVNASVVLLAGQPGIGKSTLLLHVLARLASQGHRCLLASGEESHKQVAARARRLGLSTDDNLSFIPGRDLAEVIDTASVEKPFLLAVDSIQALRDVTGTQMPGGVSQVRTCTDALVGLAKSQGIAVLITGHVTKDGDLAGPRALEHAVDVVLSFDGETHTGLRVLSGGKNRFGTEGESAWFEMGEAGLAEVDPARLLGPSGRVAGAATALPQAGRRALAVEIQALVGSSEGPSRRQATGIDARRFQLVAAVVDRVAGFGIGRSELFAAAAGGIRIDDPACDLAIAAALASAATGMAPPEGSAFVGEVSLTGMVRPAPALSKRLSAARAAGCEVVYAASPARGDRIEIPPGIRLVEVRSALDALSWARGSARSSGTVKGL